MFQHGAYKPQAADRMLSTETYAPIFWGQGTHIPFPIAKEQARLWDTPPNVEDVTDDLSHSATNHTCESKKAYML